MRDPCASMLCVSFVAIGPTLRVISTSHVYLSSSRNVCKDRDSLNVFEVPINRRHQNKLQRSFLGTADDRFVTSRSIYRFRGPSHRSFEPFRTESPSSLLNDVDAFLSRPVRTNISAAVWASLSLFVLIHTSNGVHGATINPTALDIQGCSVGEVQVQRTVNPVSDRRPYNLDVAHVKALVELSHPEFVDYRNHTWSCIDGRHTYATLATPGGDISEAILGLNALVKSTGTTLTDTQIDTLLDGLVSKWVSPSRPFYLHTDQHAEEHLKEALGLEPSATLDMTNPPQNLRARLLNLLVDPENVGCGHLKRTLKNVDNVYETPPALTSTAIKWYYTRLWADKKGMFQYVVLPGGHTEGSLSIVESKGCRPFQAAMVTPNHLTPSTFPSSSSSPNTDSAVPLGEGQIFLFHQKEAPYFRKQIAAYYAQGSTSMASTIEKKMNDIFAVQVASTASVLAEGRPVDTVIIQGMPP